MNQNFVKRIEKEVAEIEAAGLYKKERVITSEQGAEIIVGGKTFWISVQTITWAFHLIRK